MKKQKKPGGAALLRYLARQKGLLALYLALGPVNALAEVGLAWAMSAAVDYAMNGTLAQAGRYALLFAGYIGFSAGIDGLHKAVRHRLLGRSAEALKNDLYGAVMGLPADVFREKDTGEHLARLTADVEQVRDSCYFQLLTLYNEAFSFCAASAAMFLLSPVLGLYVLALTLAQMAVPYFFAGRIARRGKAAADARAASTAGLKESLSSFVTARLYRLEAPLGRRQSRLNRSEREKWVASRTANTLSGEVSYAFGNLMFLGIYLLGAVLVLQGRLTLAAVVGASQLMVYIASPLEGISAAIAEIQSASAQAGGLAALLAAPAEPEGETRKTGLEQGLVLQDVGFSYGGAPVLKNVTWTFEKGKKYLLTGGSGSGKSTLLGLLCRLYGGYTGSIRMDGVEIGAIARQDFAELVTCIPQEPYLYNDTLAANVRLFRPADDGQVTQALVRAGLGEYLKKAPAGLETPVGENAAGLSGGEKQRVAIARALLRGSPVLLLDESTSHLDPETARSIEQLVFGLEGVTVLLVAHNATAGTRALADRVLTLRNGALEPEAE